MAHSSKEMRLSAMSFGALERRRLVIDHAGARRRAQLGAGVSVRHAAPKQSARERCPLLWTRCGGEDQVRVPGERCDGPVEAWPTHAGSGHRSDCDGRDEPPQYKGRILEEGQFDRRRIDKTPDPKTPHCNTPRE
jgi:hypothetical protein